MFDLKLNDEIVYTLMFILSLLVFNLFWMRMRTKKSNKS